jgi:glycosyltransferase involved in cell wall biosynthesis
VIRRTLLHVYPSFEVGGSQRRFVRIANHFGDDYRHLIVALDGQTAAASMLSSDLDARLLPIPAAPRGLFGRLRLYRDLVRHWRPDLLVTANWGSIEWAMANLACGVAHLHLEDGFGPDEVDGQKSRRVWARRLLLRRSRVVLPSRTLWQLAHDCWRLPEQCLRYVPNGIDLARFGRAGGKRPGGPVPVIGTVAALRPEKNLARLLDAFALVRQSRLAQLVIAGDGPLRGALEARAAALGIAPDVVFLGPCAQPETVLAELDVFVLSSDTEQMPLSLLEAMALGCAVAATDVGDVRAMLPAMQQDFVVPRSAEDLAAAMSALLNDRMLRDQLGGANEDAVRRHYDEREMFTAYRRLYDGLP